MIDKDLYDRKLYDAIGRYIGPKVNEKILYESTDSESYCKDDTSNCGCEDCCDRKIAREEEVNWNSTYNRWNTPKEVEQARIEYEKNKTRKETSSEIDEAMERARINFVKFQEEISRLKQQFDTSLDA